PNVSRTFHRDSVGKLLAIVRRVRLLEERFPRLARGRGIAGPRDSQLAFLWCAHQRDRILLREGEIDEVVGIEDLDLEAGGLERSLQRQREVQGERRVLELEKVVDRIDQGHLLAGRLEV